jgi:hypothetical protein
LQVQESVFTFILNLNTIFMKTQFTPPHENSKILLINSGFSIVEHNKFDSYRKHKNKNWILKLLILVSMITVFQISYSQNTGWVMAPYYVRMVDGQKIKLPLPIPPSSAEIPTFIGANYSGQTGISTGVFDDYGNLLLFMVNGIPYDKNGFC